VPSEPQPPDEAYEEREVRERVRAAIALLPPRERKVIGMYYFAEATMKQIGTAIGVNESRVSQLHARAVQRLRKALGAESVAAATDLKPAILAFQQTMRRMRMAKAKMDARPGVVLPYRTVAKQAPVPHAHGVRREPRVAVAR
jgi:RNA polymerase sigma factor for flagellar operon FliA